MSLSFLFLDDDPLRHHHVEEWAKEAGLELAHAYTAEECIERLSSKLFCGVSLDHDLADAHYAGQVDERTGLAVAKWMADHASSLVLPYKVNIHSWNLPGALAMATLLLERRNFDVRINPFGPLGMKEFFKEVKEAGEVHQSFVT